MMYILSSYMMIYHDWFEVENKNESKIKFDIKPEDINEKNCPSFLSVSRLKGKLSFT